MRKEREVMIFRGGKQKKRLRGGKMKNRCTKESKKENGKPTVMLRKHRKKKDKSKKRQATERKGRK